MIETFFIWGMTTGSLVIMVLCVVLAKLDPRGGRELVLLYLVGFIMFFLGVLALNGSL